MEVIELGPPQRAPVLRSESHTWSFAEGAEQSLLGAPIMPLEVGAQQSLWAYPVPFEEGAAQSTVWCITPCEWT